jgi:hypothetical protein
MNEQDPSQEIFAATLPDTLAALVATEGLHAAVTAHMKVEALDSRLQELVEWSRRDAVEEPARRSEAMTSPGPRYISPASLWIHRFI